MLADPALRDRLAAGALRARGALHVGGDGARDPRGAGRRGDAPAPPPVTRTLHASPGCLSRPWPTSSRPVSTRCSPRARRGIGYLAARGARVRPAPADRAGQGRGRHQAVPLPRPGSAPGAGVVDVGPEHRLRHRHPPEHRLPVPDGAVLLGPRPRRRARLGRAAALARQRSCSSPGSGCSTSSARSACAARARPSARSRSCSARTRSTTRRGISVILLPWAGLPWMLAFVIRGVAPRRLAVSRAVRARGAGDRQRQRDRARLRGHRAGALDPVRGLGAARGRRSRRALATVVQDRRADARRVAVVDVRALGAGELRPRHPASTPRRSRRSSRTSLPNEVLRGLGYWFFYGRDKLGPWIEASADYTQRPLLHPRSATASPVLALLSAAFVRWRHRAFFVLLTLVGVVDRGRRAPVRQPDAVRRRRSSSSRRSRRPRSRCAAPAGRCRSSCSGSPVLLGAGRQRAGRGWLTRPRSPAAGRWPSRSLVGVLRDRQPARALERHVLRQEPATARGDPAVLEGRGEVPRRAARTTPACSSCPASDFASYRWGNTVDPITPGLMDRPYVARELIPYGSPASANLLNAFDLRHPGPPAPARRDRADGADDGRRRRRAAQRPPVRALPADPARCSSGDLFTPTPDGPAASRRRSGSRRRPRRTQYPFLDEQALGGRPNLALPPPVAVFPVKHPKKIVSAEAGSAARS